MNKYINKMNVENNKKSERVYEQCVGEKMNERMNE